MFKQSSKNKKNTAEVNSFKIVVRYFFQFNTNISAAKIGGALSKFLEI